jgi:hypothetical protein
MVEAGSGRATTALGLVVVGLLGVLVWHRGEMDRREREVEARLRNALTAYTTLRDMRRELWQAQRLLTSLQADVQGARRRLEEAGVEPPPLLTDLEAVRASIGIGRDRRR